MEQFEWCLIEHGESANYQTGIGSTESMPYADQALVLMHTLDVRLIEIKVPMANAKKLQQMLPNLVEDYLLSGLESTAIQAFPPVPGKLAIQRTVAILDRVWYAWLCKQLERLLCPRVRLIPDCFMLDWHSELDSEDQIRVAPAISLMRIEGNVVLTKRTGEQLGVAWVESENTDAGSSLPSIVGHDQPVEIGWDWLAPCAVEYIKVTTNSKAANFALNLLPKTFRRQNHQLGKTGLAEMLVRKRGEQNINSTVGMAWNDALIWRPAFLWATIAVSSMVLGLVLHLTWLAVDNWRWDKQMNLMAAQSLSSASAASLAQNIANADLVGGSNSYTNPTTVLQAFIKQVTLQQRRQGVSTDADFAAMTAKLMQLTNLFGPDVLQRIDYDGFAIVFAFKSDKIPQNGAEVIQKAQSLGLVVKPLGANRYRLEPYAGLGVSL